MRTYLPKGMAVWGEFEEMGAPPWLDRRGWVKTADLTIQELTRKRAIRGASRRVETGPEDRLGKPPLPGERRGGGEAGCLAYGLPATPGRSVSQFCG